MGKGRVLYLDQDCGFESLFARLPNSQKDVYYTSCYYLVYQNNGNGRALCFVYEDDSDIALYPFLLNPILTLGYSLPDEYFDIQGAYGYNGIVSSTKDPGFIASFHKSFDTFCQKQHIIAEFSRFHPIINNHTLASPLMELFLSRHTVKLDLSQSLEDIWAYSFSSKNRNVIKKAEKDGVMIVESEDYESFRKMYDETMRNVGAEDFFFFPERYYSDFQKMCKDDLMLCFAMYNGKPISGSMFMFCGDYAHYHLSGRDSDYSKIAASNAVLWYAIKKAKERGCKWFHFGGGTTGDEMDPLLHFKKNFSKELGEFWFGKRIHNQTVYDEVKRQWEEKHPESYERNSGLLLGYRVI